MLSRSSRGDEACHLISSGGTGEGAFIHVSCMSRESWFVTQEGSLSLKTTSHSAVCAYSRIKMNKLDKKGLWNNVGLRLSIKQFASVCL